VEKRCEEL
jgi:chromosome segregation ATPase